MKYAKFESLVRVPGTTKFVQGIKNGRTPKNAVAGGNGSFIVGQRGQLILSLRDEDDSLLRKDIYHEVKKYTQRKITDNFCYRLIGMMNPFEFKVENGNIINLDEILSLLD